MAKLIDALYALRDSLEETDIINRQRFNALCARHITTDRGQATFLWNILSSEKFFVQINGTSWRINHEMISAEIAAHVNHDALKPKVQAQDPNVQEA